MCITLPPAPPPLAPPPAPVLPPPAPSPTPTNPASPLIVFDAANSYVLAPGDNAITFPQILLQNGRVVAAFSANMGLYFQNNGAAPGTIACSITADNGNLTVTPPSSVVPVPANNYVVANFQLFAAVVGTYNVTITIQGGATITFPMVFNGPETP